MGYKVTIKGNENANVVFHELGEAHAYVFKRDNDWSVPKKTPNIRQQALIKEYSHSKAPTQLWYIERSLSVENADAQNNWLFDLGQKVGIDVPIYFFAGFEIRDKLNFVANDNGVS